MSRHAMSSADAAWLHMDRPTNLMIINAILWFDQPLDRESLRDEQGMTRCTTFRTRSTWGSRSRRGLGPTLSTMRRGGLATPSSASSR